MRIIPWFRPTYKAAGGLALLALMITALNLTGFIGAAGRAPGEPAPVDSPAALPRTITAATKEIKLPVHGSVGVLVACPAGYRVISGGGGVFETDSGWLISSDLTGTAPGSGWLTVGQNDIVFASAGVMQTQIICSRTGRVVIP